MLKIDTHHSTCYSEATGMALLSNSTGGKGGKASVFYGATFALDTAGGLSRRSDYRAMPYYEPLPEGLRQAVEQTSTSTDYPAFKRLVSALLVEETLPTRVGITVRDSVARQGYRVRELKTSSVDRIVVCDWLAAVAVGETVRLLGDCSRSSRIVVATDGNGSGVCGHYDSAEALLRIMPLDFDGVGPQTAIERLAPQIGLESSVSVIVDASANTNVLPSGLPILEAAAMGAAGLACASATGRLQKFKVPQVAA